MRCKTELLSRVKQIATNLSDMQKAVTLSTQLELNPDRSCVRRCIPFEMREIGPEYSVYVEGLSSQWNHDTVSKIFASCGEITYISLPRHAQSGQFRGFGFIEFKTGCLCGCKVYRIVEGATKALSLNGHHEASWVNSLKVISKQEWLQKKAQYKSKTSRHGSEKVHKSIPYLVASYLREGATAKELWRLFSSIGPIHSLEVYKGEETTEWVNSSSCVVQYESEIVGLINWGDRIVY